MNGKKARTIRKIWGVKHVRLARLNREEIRNVPRGAMTGEQFLRRLDRETFAARGQEFPGCSA